MSPLLKQSIENFDYGYDIGDFVIKSVKLEFIQENSKVSYFLKTWLPNWKFLKWLKFSKWEWFPY